ncbi:MAG: 3'-5' exonuclease [Gammaproteobacteria bacterium]
MNLFVFEIETIPDIEGGRRLYDLAGLTDKEVANVMFHKRRQETGTENLRLHLQRIVAISAVLRTSDDLTVWSLGGEIDSEKEMIREFFEVIEKHAPDIISWNGKRFDLPVLHFRSLVHGIKAPQYWENSEKNENLTLNNFVSHSQSFHTGLMESLAGHEMPEEVPLHEVACLLGFPGKVGMSSASVWDNYRAENIALIRSSCETVALNTYLVYLRYQLIRGKLTKQEFEAECDIVQNILASENKNHFTEFLKAWQR